MVSQVTSTDVSTANAISFINNRSPFLSLWDGGYFKNGNLVQTQIDGFNSSKEMPSFFGSKLVKLPGSITLDTWTVNTVSGGFNNGVITLSYNITKAIENIFNNNQTFLSNWSGLSSSNLSNIINNYIKDTVLNWYNVNINNITLKIYTISNNAPNVIEYFQDPNKTYTELTNQNMDSKLTIANGEYLYNIKLNNIVKNNNSYFVKFFLFEK